MIEVRNTADDTVLLKYSGELDLYQAPELKEGYTELDKNGVRNLVIDLNDVDYVDSSGLGTLLFIYSDTKSRGIKYFIKGFRKQMVKSIVKDLKLHVEVIQ